VTEPANQGWTSTVTPEPIYSSTDIIEIDESTTTLYRRFWSWLADMVTGSE